MRIAAALLSATAILGYAMGVDVSKFRSCAESAFCRKYEQEKSAVMSGLSISTSHVKVMFKDSDYVNVFAYAGGIVRFQGTGPLQKQFDLEEKSLKWISINPSLPQTYELLAEDGSLMLQIKKQNEILLLAKESRVSVKDLMVGRIGSNAKVSWDVDGVNWHGLPLHTTPLVLPDTKDEPLRFYNSDVFEYALDSPMALYGAIPFALGTSKGKALGVLWNNPSDTFVDIHNKELAFMSELGNAIDLYLFFGSNPKHVLNKYTLLTGRPVMPPLFSLGYHQCRWNYRSTKDVKSVDGGFDEHAIPYDVLWLDIEHTEDKKYFTFDQEKFKEHERMIGEIKEKGRHMVVIVDPHIKKDPEYNVYKELSSGNYGVKTADSRVFEGDCWPGKSVWVDFISLQAQEWWASLFPKYYPYENVHIWNDMNEPAVFNIDELSFPRDALHSKNDTLVEHRLIHNLYGQAMHQATRKGLLKRSHDKRPFVLSRSFYAGSQTIGPIWTGDNAADWGHLRASIPMILSLGLAGMPFTGADVGGFFGNPEPELLVRWYQLGAMQPFFRGHAHIETKRREPWVFGTKVTKVIQRAIRLRYRLLPYIYTCFYEAHINGSPVNRPLFMEFEDLNGGINENSVFMIGPALLFAPILELGQSTMGIILPSASKWYDFRTLTATKLIEGNVTLETQPLYIRGGYVVLTKEMARRSTKAMTKDPYTVLVALDHEGSAMGDIFVDGGDGFEYMSGGAVSSKLVYSDNSLINTVATAIEERKYSVAVTKISILGLAFNPAKVFINNTLHLDTRYEHDTLHIQNISGLRLDAPWTVHMVNSVDLK